jgi:hypothetical protein
VYSKNDFAKRSRERLRSRGFFNSLMNQMSWLNNFIKIFHFNILQIPMFWTIIDKIIFIRTVERVNDESIGNGSVEKHSKGTMRVDKIM